MRGFPGTQALNLAALSLELAWRYRYRLFVLYSVPWLFGAILLSTVRVIRSQWIDISRFNYHWSDSVAFAPATAVFLILALVYLDNRRQSGWLDSANPLNRFLLTCLLSFCVGLIVSLLPQLEANTVAGMAPALQYNASGPFGSYPEPSLQLQLLALALSIGTLVVKAALILGCTLLLLSVVLQKENSIGVYAAIVRRRPITVLGFFFLLEVVYLQIERIYYWGSGRLLMWLNLTWSDKNHPYLSGWRREFALQLFDTLIWYLPALVISLVWVTSMYVFHVYAINMRGKFTETDIRDDFA